jgi:hypothetical protein
MKDSMAISAVSRFQNLDTAFFDSTVCIQKFLNSRLWYYDVILILIQTVHPQFSNLAHFNCP